MGFDPVQIAFALGTPDGLMVDLEPPADSFKRLRRIGAATVRDEGGRGAIPDARRIEDHQCRPCGFRGAIAPARMVREYPSRTRMLHHLTPSGQSPSAGYQ